MKIYIGKIHNIFLLVSLQEFIKVLKINECFATNIKLSSNVFNFVLNNNIR
jgi:hypothetical protein